MDLLSPRAYWPVRDGLPASFPALPNDASCEVAVLGAGITGAMSAALLAEAGCDVIVLDRREAAHGSTAGSTGLLQYELDVPLCELQRRIGAERAARAYRRCAGAVAGLGRLVRRQGIDCGFARRPSLYLASTEAHVPRLRREFEARAAAGLDVEWIGRAALARMSSLPHPAAIRSGVGGEIDAYRLAYGLLGGAAARGARVFDRTEVARIQAGRRGVELRIRGGGRVRARHLVMAGGYEAARFAPRRTTRLQSTYALASEPVARLEGWPPGHCLLWETRHPYAYARTTPDGRVMAGGYDEPFTDPDRRDRLLPAKTRLIERKLRAWFPGMVLQTACAWAGTFAETDDGLPYIGCHPRHPSTWFALGYGGNGITFSLIAAEAIRDGIMEGNIPDSDIFGFGRQEQPPRAGY